MLKSKLFKFSVAFAIATGIHYFIIRKDDKLDEEVERPINVEC